MCVLWKGLLVSRLSFSVNVPTLRRLELKSDSLLRVIEKKSALTKKYRTNGFIKVIICAHFRCKKKFSGHIFLLCKVELKAAFGALIWSC